MPERNYTEENRQKVADRILGMRIDRAISNVAQTGVLSIFNIVGGRVLVTNILGEVTTVLGVVGNMSLEANPTTGTMAVLSGLLAAGGLEEGCMIALDGTKATNLLGVTAGGRGMATNSVTVQIGTIDQRCSASDTGQMRWSVWYVPIEDGAYITAA